MIADQGRNKGSKTASSTTCPVMVSAETAVMIPNEISSYTSPTSLTE